MARTLDDMIKGLPLDQQREIEAKAAWLIEEEMTLRDLRKAHALTVWDERLKAILRGDESIKVVRLPRTA